MWHGPVALGSALDSFEQLVLEVVAEEESGDELVTMTMPTMTMTMTMTMSVTNWGGRMTM